MGDLAIAISDWRCISSQLIVQESLSANIRSRRSSRCWRSTSGSTLGSDTVLSKETMLLAVWTILHPKSLSARSNRGFKDISNDDFQMRKVSTYQSFRDRTQYFRDDPHCWPRRAGPPTSGQTAIACGAEDPSSRWHRRQLPGWNWCRTGSCRHILGSCRWRRRCSGRRESPGGWGHRPGNRETIRCRRLLMQNKVHLDRKC